MPAKINEIDKQQDTWYRMKPGQVIEYWRSDEQQGLSEQEVVLRLRQYGRNELPEERGDDYLNILLRQIRSPLVYILLFAAFISLVLQHYSDLAIISAVIIVNVAIGFLQEYRANSTLTELKRVIKHYAKVVRGGTVKRIASSELVPGDIIVLSAGDQVPADARLVSANSLQVTEAALTGESVPSLKQTAELDHDAPVADQDSMVFMGTEVAAGKTRAVVVATGLRTELGRVADLLTKTISEATPLQKNLAQFSKWLAWVTLFVSFALLGIGIIQGRDFFEMLVTAVAVAVAVIPEGLLISLTVILAIGMQRILKKRGLVRHLAAAETLGATSIICTDKTGTLTLGEMRVTTLVGPSEELRKIKKMSELKESEGLLKILRTALAVNESAVENPEDDFHDWKIMGNPTDRALTLSAAEAGFIKSRIDHTEPLLSEIPFDEQRKYAVTLRRLGPKHHIVYMKGAAEVVLKLVKYYENNGRAQSLDEKQRAILAKKLDELTRDGLRVLGVAYRKASLNVADLHDEQRALNGLVFAGFIGLRDPLRDEVPGVIKTALRAGLRPIIITGDHKQTALSIAREAGLKVVDYQAIEGPDLDAMDDEKFAKKVKEISIYARVTPSHKLRIIDAWKQQGQVVAMTGDGVNDAPALRRADIGMSLGSGTQVAQSASDLVLLDNNFKTIVSAIEEGRIMYNNLRKVITYLLADSFTQIILISGALILHLPIPLLPAQILWNNLISDGFPNLALTVEPGTGDEMVQKPRKRNEPLINKEMKTIILFVGILMDLAVLSAYWYFIGLGQDLHMVRTVVFAALGSSSLVLVFSMKSLTQPLWRLKFGSNGWIWVSLTAGFGLLFAAIYYPPLQSVLQTVALSGDKWYWVGGLTLVKVLAVEITKVYYNNIRVRA